MISQCDVETTKTYGTICFTITYSVVNIESEFKYENQGLMEKIPTLCNILQLLNILNFHSPTRGNFLSN